MWKNWVFYDFMVSAEKAYYQKASCEIIGLLMLLVMVLGTLMPYEIYWKILLLLSLM